MPGAFTPQFAEQLASVSQLPVKQAENGEILRAGQVYVCPGDSHLRVAPPGRVALDSGPRIAGYRPSIDVTLESVAALAGPQAAVAILTGMGNDGARGVMAIQANGGLVLAQDESTSVIFGMPAEAIKTGAVEQVLPLQQIAAAISRRVAGHPGTARAAAYDRGRRRRSWRSVKELERRPLFVSRPGQAGCGHRRPRDPVYRRRSAICRAVQRGRGDSRS